jgi:hypothetical protein
MQTMFMLITLLLSSFQASAAPGGIYCHRGGNGKFYVDLQNDSIEVESLFSDRRRESLAKKQNSMALLKLEGAYLAMDKLYGSNGYINIKARDYYSRTMINLNIENIDDLLNEKTSRVNAKVTIFRFTDNIDELIREFTASLKCELN